jgi:hypothetical protein
VYLGFVKFYLDINIGVVMKSHQAKTIWKELQQELITSQDKVNWKLKASKENSVFLKFLEANFDDLNILDVDYINFKFGHYGKLITTQLIIPKNGRLYFEKAYYPLAKKYFGKLRLSISNRFVFSKHYMERLIERKNITSIQDIKKEISDSFKKLDDSNFTKEIGGLDISTGFILLFRDSVSFCDLEIDDNNIAEAVMKTVITENELKGNQKEIIDYILNVTKTDSCFLATYDIPRSIGEADKIIEDTKKRTSGLAINWMEHEIQKTVVKGSYNSDKKYLKAFIGLLENYDPNSPKFKNY